MQGFAKRRPFDAGYLLGAALSTLVYAWVLIGGFPLAARTGSRQHYYTFAAMSLLQGRLDVPEVALAGECFLIHHRCYGYFGVTPSLLRLPVALVAGDRAFSNHVEAVFFALGFAVVAAGLWWLARQLVAARSTPGTPARLRIVGFAVASSLAASPLLFLASRPLVYEEAILWGVAFGTLALAAAVPFTTLAAIAGVAWTVGALRRPRPERTGGPAPGMAVAVLASAGVAVGVQLAFSANTYRYLGDWLPFLAVAGTVGLAALAVHRPPSARRGAAVAAVGAVLLTAQLVIQVGLAVQNGLDAGGEHPATCRADENPYGKLGEIFCPLET